MSRLLYIILLFLLVCSCTDDQRNQKKSSPLPQGTFYLNYKLSNDTMKFQRAEYDQGGWNNTVWRITEDSIFQEDSRGLSYSFGRDRCSYTMLDDTLTVSFRSRLRARQGFKDSLGMADIYLVLNADEDHFELLRLDRSPMFNNRIRSDIQLR